MNLYELTAEYMWLQNVLEDPEADVDMINQALDDLDDELEHKADNYAKIIRNMDASITAIKEEQERLAAKRNLLESSIKRLKDNLQAAMITTGKKKFKTDLFSFNIQKNGGALPVIVDVETAKLPDDLVIISEKPDLKAIAKYIEETGDISYAHFGERGESLRIK